MMLRTFHLFIGHLYIFLEVSDQGFCLEGKDWIWPGLPVLIPKSELYVFKQNLASNQKGEESAWDSISGKERG